MENEIQTTQTNQNYEIEVINIGFKTYEAKIMQGEILDIQEARDSVISGVLNGSFRSFNGIGSGGIKGSLSTAIQVKKTIFVRLASGKEIQVNIKGDVVSLRVGQELTLCEVNNNYIFIYNHNTEDFYNFFPYLAPWDNFVTRGIAMGITCLLFITIPVGVVTSGLGIIVGLFFLLSLFFVGAEAIPNIIYSALAAIGGFLFAMLPIFLLTLYLKIPGAKNKKIIDNIANKFLQGKNIDNYINISPF